MVRYVGVSNWQAWKIMKAQGLAQHRGWARFETLQAYYSIAGRDLEREIVPLLWRPEDGADGVEPARRRLAFGKIRPRQQRAGGPRDASPSTFRRSTRIARGKASTRCARSRTGNGVSVARVALAWILAKSFVTSIIIGAKTMEQLDDNLDAVKLGLSADEMKTLDEV